MGKMIPFVSRAKRFNAIAPLIGLADMSHVVNGLNFDKIKANLEEMPLYQAEKRRAALHGRVLQLVNSKNLIVAERAWKLMVQMISFDFEKADLEGRGGGNREVFDNICW